ncbi:MAG TPA: DinB family protein [Ignavibacteria bacterium]|nr:DinB family protein [Ignavibacteria bacterium]
MKPNENEFPVFYKPYIDEIDGEDILEILTSQGKTAIKFLKDIPESIGTYRYEKNKWSIKEIIGHLADAERVFAYRLMRISRGDKTDLPGFDENFYIANGRYNEMSMKTLIDGLLYLRASTVNLVSQLSDEELNRSGSSNGSPITANSLAYIIAGHMEHHINVINERYLSS